MDLNEQEYREQVNALLAVRKILESPEGQDFMLFLFKTLQVGELPARGIEGIDLHETLGYLRAGHSVYQLAVQANPTTATNLMARIEREKYAEVLSKVSRG